MADEFAKIRREVWQVLLWGAPASSKISALTSSQHLGPERPAGLEEAADIANGDCRIASPRGIPRAVDVVGRGLDTVLTCRRVAIITAVKLVYLRGKFVNRALHD
jgi:hypothetical protein